MKIYKLTIGIDEKKEQVEFIQEEQYEVEDKPKGTVPKEMNPHVNMNEEDFDSFIELLIRGKFNIIGKA